MRASAVGRAYGLEVRPRRPGASPFLTSDCEIRNCRAIADGLTPALKAARTAFSWPDVNDPKYWQQRAKEARRLAERMPDETVKQTMLSVAEECDKFAIRAAIHSIEEL